MHPPPPALIFPVSMVTHHFACRMHPSLCQGLGAWPVPPSSGPVPAALPPPPGESRQPPLPHRPHIYFSLWQRLLGRPSPTPSASLRSRGAPALPSSRCLKVSGPPPSASGPAPRPASHAPVRLLSHFLLSPVWQTGKSSPQTWGKAWGGRGSLEMGWSAEGRWRGHENPGLRQESGCFSNNVFCCYFPCQISLQGEKPELHGKQQQQLVSGRAGWILVRPPGPAVREAAPGWICPDRERRWCRKWRVLQVELRRGSVGAAENQASAPPRAPP